MNDFTKEELERYISFRRNALNALLETELTTIEAIRLHASLYELDGLEEWFTLCGIYISGNFHEESSEARLVSI